MIQTMAAAAGYSQNRRSQPASEELTPMPDPIPSTAPRCVLNHLTGKPYTLRPLDGSWTPALLEIVRVCNEPRVYELFRRKLSGVPYGLENAGLFVAWAERGWQFGTHFVLALLSEPGCVVGALDIKSPERDCAEIGYWLSAYHRGLMTNAVVELQSIAREMGYRGLYARVRPENLPSAAVLLRAGFTETQPVEQAGQAFRNFLVRL